MSILGGLLKRRGRASGREDQARGDLAEMRVVSCLRRLTRPWWIQGVRRASAHEDRTGIDVVVETVDHGRLFLQVKSSKAGAERWRKKHRRDPRPIGLVVVRPGDDSNTVYGRTLGALILLRERAMLPERTEERPRA